MAGIINAMRMRIENRYTGHLLKKGEFYDEKKLIKFLIVKLDRDMGIEPVYSYDGGDIQFQEDLIEGEGIYLDITSSWSAMWKSCRVEEKITKEVCSDGTEPIDHYSLGDISVDKNSNGEVTNLKIGELEVNFAKNAEM